AERSDGAAGALRGAAALAGRGRRRGAAVRRGLRRGAGVRDATDRRHGPGDRPGDDAPDRPDQHPRSHPVPADAHAERVRARVLPVTFIREQPDLVRATLVARGDDPTLVDEIVALDARRRALLQEEEAL